MKRKAFLFIGEPRYILLLALAAAALVVLFEPETGKHDKNMLKTRHLKNYTINNLSSNQQLIWETRKVRLTGKNG